MFLGFAVSGRSGLPIDTLVASDHAWENIVLFGNVYVALAVVNHFVNHPIFQLSLSAFATPLLLRWRDFRRTAFVSTGLAAVEVGLLYTSASLFPRTTPAHAVGSYPAIFVASAVGYWGFLASEAAQQPRFRGCLIVLLIPIIGSVFVSLYFGESWLTDVLGGVLIGGGIALAAIFVSRGGLRLLQRA